MKNFLPRPRSGFGRSRISRWYGELGLLERDVRIRTGTLPIEQWLANLDRIEQRAGPYTENSKLRP